MQAKILKWATGWALVLVVAVVVFGPERPAVADRHGKAAEERSKLMKDMGGAMRALKGFMEGRNSAGEASEAVAVIAAAAAKIPDVFPPGTGMGADPKSESKDVIWEKWDDFKAAAALLGDKTAALETALASGDAGAVGAAARDLGKNGCGGCHRQFREKRN